MRVPRGVSYILYIWTPENPQSPCKPLSGYISGLNIPTIFLGIPYIPTCKYTLSIDI